MNLGIRPANYSRNWKGLTVQDLSTLAKICKDLLLDFGIQMLHMNNYIYQPGSSVMVVNSIASVVVFNSLDISDTANVKSLF